MPEHNSSKNKVEFDVSVCFQGLKEPGELHSCRTRNLVLLDSDLRRADGNEDLDSVFVAFMHLVALSA
jgi:hypothetical protein